MVNALSLISSGIDSPVATYVMLKQGLKVDCVHFNTDERSLEKVQKLIKQISERTNKKIQLFDVPFKEIQKAIAEKVYPRYRCVVCKRMMYRIAEAIANKKEYQYLITGESLGQVASQTLHNMYVLDRSIKITILRPVLCNDKQETINKAIDIGTYDISILRSPSCALLPKNPATKANLDKVEEEEEKLNLVEIICKAVENIK
ncbi:7-cyano-7-deazaguanine synthase [Candidatus Woesearchaeota archaeon]|nr:7-cyano-7-deazaguanine synthase [Candidatus Woesearchaeota archaeon]